MADQLDITTEFAKAVIGSAANMVLPGVGSLAVAGVAGLMTRSDLNREVAAALDDALKSVATPSKTRFWEVQEMPTKVRSRLRARKARRVLRKGVSFAELMTSAHLELNEKQPVDENAAQTTATESAPAEPQADTGEIKDDSDNEGTGSFASDGWRRLARAQLLLAQSPAQPPGSWQDEFSDLLEAIAIRGLEDSQFGSNWRTLVAGDTARSPSPAELQEWSRLVTRVFASEMEKNNNLAPCLKQLAEHDRRASEAAFFWQLDTQRRAIHFIAVMLFGLAIAAGVDIGLHP